MPNETRLLNRPKAAVSGAYVVAEVFETMKHRIFSILTLIGMLLVSLAPVAAQEETECEDGFRLIVHRMSETCVPETAQRIVVLGPASFEFAYLAGKTIIGAPG